MKKARIMLAAIIAIGLTSGGVALRAQKFGSALFIANTCSINGLCPTTGFMVNYTTVPNVRSVFIFGCTLAGAHCEDDADCQRGTVVYYAQ